MFYVKINEKIREYLNLLSIKLGCKYYCKQQLIALDELELLRKELENKNIQKLTDEEFKNLIKSSDCVYFNSVHLCQTDKNDNKVNKEEDSEHEDGDNINEKAKQEILKDKICKNEKNPFVYFDKIDREYEDCKKQHGDSVNVLSNSEIKLNSKTSISTAISMLASFFLLALGSYYMGKHLFGWDDSNTYKLVLVVTIVVFISESFLLIIRLNKEASETITPKVIKESSFAYKFNKKYRETFIDGKDYGKTKVGQKPKAD